MWVGAGDGVAELEVVVSGIGLVLRSASTAAAALAELAERPAAACLLDCTRGSEALRLARAIRADRPSAILIGVVDPARPETTLDAFRAGVFDVLPSPVVPWDLSAVISNAHDLADLSAIRRHWNE